MEIESTGLGFLLVETEPYGLDLVTQRQTDAKDQNATNNKEERSKQNPTTQVSILTKPRLQKLQVMEIRSDVWFLATAPVEESSNDVKTLQPRHRLPNPGGFSPITKLKQWKSNRTHGFSPPLQWRKKNTLESGFDFLFWIWFVHGFLGLRSGEWDNIWRERKGRTRKKSMFWLSWNRV